MMSSTDIIDINCLTAGDTPQKIFTVKIASNKAVGHLKQKIKEALGPIPLDAVDIQLFKVSLAPDDPNLASDPHEIEGAEDLSSPLKKISDVFKDVLDSQVVHVIAVLPPSANNLSSTASVRAGVNSDGINQYDAIFINVAEWGGRKRNFNDIDISLTRVERDWQGREATPTFVKDYLDKSDKKAGLSPEAWKYFDTMDPECRTTYFVTAGGSPASTIQGTEGRDANLPEAQHIRALGSMPWHSAWQHRIAPPKELADTMFFFPFCCTYDNQDVYEKVTATLGTSIWPFPLILKKKLTADVSEIRSYSPRSDFRLSYQDLPRVLVEANSTTVSADQQPPELMRMLLCGASVVRFANGFIDPFKQHRNFVLAAIYIRQYGWAEWYTLYQYRNQIQVYYSKETFDFNKPVGRVKFALRLYNLYFAIDGEGNARSQIEAYKQQVNTHMPKLKSFHTGRDSKRDTTDSGEGNARTRSRGDGYTELKAHGYVVEPDYIETEDGIFESLRKLPSNLLTVFRPSDTDTMLVAKKIRKDSDELEILQLIHHIQPQSEHIITLLDSFHEKSSSWAILPKIMNTVEDWLYYDLKKFSPHLSPVCWGLIKGLAYLHEHHIAHRDIKPDNLLVDHKFCLKIIDFDVAVQVRDDDEEVDDHCGTEGWVAPEIERRLPTYSPIKADRWSCGAVILYIFGRLRQTDTMLEAIAKKLKVDTPEHRLPLVEWPKWSQAAPVVHAGTAVKRERAQSSDEEMLVELANDDDVGRKRSRIDKSYVDSSAVEAEIHPGGTDTQ